MSKWISVKDRLPEANTYYLTYSTESPHGPPPIWIHQFISSNSDEYANFLVNPEEEYEITHWMPLPEPPK